MHNCLISRETLINCLRKRFAALGGAQKLAYLLDMSHFLRSYHLARRISQRFPSLSVPYRYLPDDHFSRCFFNLACYRGCYG